MDNFTVDLLTEQLDYYRLRGHYLHLEALRASWEDNRKLRKMISKIDGYTIYSSFDDHAQRMKAIAKSIDDALYKEIIKQFSKARPTTILPIEVLLFVYTILLAPLICITFSMIDEIVNIFMWIISPIVCCYAPPICQSPFTLIHQYKIFGFASVFSYLLLRTIRPSSPSSRTPFQIEKLGNSRRKYQSNGGPG